MVRKQRKKVFNANFWGAFSATGGRICTQNSLLCPQANITSRNQLRVRTNRIFFPHRLCEGVGAVNVCKYLLESPKKMALLLGKAELPEPRMFPD